MNTLVLLNVSFYALFRYTNTIQKCKNIIQKDINLTDKLYYFDNNNLEKLEFKNKIEFQNIKFQFENRKELFSNLNFRSFDRYSS